ncbi:hypothetical protein Tco_1289363 [Tanacetum coccineum]
MHYEGNMTHLSTCLTAFVRTLKKLKKYNQLLKLMKFLMGLNEVYASIRSIILTIDPTPDVKGAFATLSRDESHKST